LAQFVAQYLKENQLETHQEGVTVEEINQFIQFVRIQDAEDSVCYQKKSGI